MANVIEIVITGDEKGYIAAVKRAEQATGSLGQTSGQAGRQAAAGLGAVSEQAERLRLRGTGLQQSLSLVAHQLGALGPAGGLAANAVLAVVASAGVLGISLAAASAVIGFFITHFQASAAEAKRFKEALASGDISFFEQRLAGAREELNKFRMQIVEVHRLIQSAPPGSPFGRAQAAGLAQLGAKEAGLLSKVAEEEGRADEARRKQALKALPEMEQRIGAENRLLQAREAGRPAIEAQILLESLRAKGLREEDLEVIRLGLSERVRTLQRKESAEAEAKSVAALIGETEKEAKAQETLTAQAHQLNEAFALQAVEMTQGEEAALRLKLNLMGLSDELQEIVLNAFRATGALKQSREEWRAFDEEREREDREGLITGPTAESESRRRDSLRGQIDQQQQLNILEADRLGVLGRTREAEELRLRAQLQQIQALKDSGLLDPGLADAQAQLVLTRMHRLGAITLDIGAHVAQTLETIWDAMLRGTLKGIDVLRAGTAFVGNIVTDLFRQVLAKKISFELELFNNLRQLPAQANAALAAGGAAAPGGASAPGGGGGFLSSILGGLGDFILPGLGGFALGSLIGGGRGGLFGAAGAIGGSLLSGSIALNALAGPLVGIINQILPLAWAITSQQFLNFVLPGLGAILGGLFALFFTGSTKKPSVTVRPQLEGFGFDPLLGEFRFGDIRTRLLGSRDVSGGTAAGVQDSVQQAMVNLARVWTDILNLFPQFIRERMLPGLEAANEALRTMAGRALKFRETSGSTIAEQLRRFAEVTAPRRFFFGLRGLVGTGIAESLGAAGLGDLAGAVAGAFPIPAEGASATEIMKLSGLTPPRNKKRMEEFMRALSEFAGLSGALAGISPRGVTQFLTAPDMSLLRGEFETLLSVREGGQFAPAFEAFKQRVGPVIQFLEQAARQTEELFGRGIMAALQAVSESEAQAAFFRILGEGTKQVIFQGITEAFIASAQFSDLLAPIQQTIRQFAQQAIATGTLPDLAAFRAALLPGVEAISTRAELLSPLIAELQRLGLDITTALSGLTGAFQSPIIVNINVETLTGASTDLQDLAGQIGLLIQQQTTSPV